MSNNTRRIHYHWLLLSMAYIVMFVTDPRILFSTLWLLVSFFSMDRFFRTNFTQLDDEYKGT